MENVELLHRLVKRMDALDLFGQVYEALRTTQSEDWRTAIAQDREEPFLRDVIAASKRTWSTARVFSTAITDPTGEGLGRSAGGYTLGDPTALLMLPKIQRSAMNKANETMREYLDWLQRNHLGESDAAIAETVGKSEATIRGGRKRAVDFLVEVAHDLRHGGQTCEGPLPKALARAAERLMEHDHVRCENALEGCKAELGHDPRWLNIAGLLDSAQDNHTRAIVRFKEGLTLADDVMMRAKLLNNWGKALHNLDRLEEAQAIYLRASRLMPNGAPPLLNLLAIASERRDLQDCRYYANQLVKLLGSGKLPKNQKGIVMNRLTNNPMYDWVKRTEAWKGPARWLRRWSAVAILLLTALSFTLLQAPSTSVANTPPNNTEATDKGEGWIKPTTPNVRPSKISPDIPSPHPGGCGPSFPF